MRVLVTGAGGMIGRAVCDALLARGDAVVGLSRTPERARQSNLKVEWHSWNPTLERPPEEALAGVDAVVNLIGEPINQRWTDEAKQRIRESRITATRNLVTAMLAILMMSSSWKWSPVRIAIVMMPFLALELVFLSANLLKVDDGGWVTLLIGAVMLAIMLVWWRGSNILLAKTRRSELPLAELMPSLERSRVAIVPGTGVYLTANADNTPTALLHTIKHFKVMHERIVVLTVITSDWPYLGMAESVSMEPVSDRLIRVRVVIGFMQQANIPAVLDYCRTQGLPGESASTSFMLSRREVKAERPSAMPLPATALFIVLANNAGDATGYFGIPKDRVVEIGTQVGL